MTLSETSIADICRQVEDTGFALIRQCFKPAEVSALKARIDALYERMPDQWHIEPRQLRDCNAAPLHNDVFQRVHILLLNALFKDDGWAVSESTCTRRLGVGHPTRMHPLAPHVDAMFHDPAFTCNFWTPLKACGDGVVPGLTVWAKPLAEIKDYLGYSDETNSDAKWNFARFRPFWHQVATNERAAEFRERMGDGFSPQCEIGDAMLLTNWTLHATGPGDYTVGRENVELRFVAQ